MWDLDCKESWTPKYWCFCTVVLEKTLDSLLDSKEIKPVNPKGNQSWIFIARTDAETEAPILWAPDEKSWLIGKVPDYGKDWRQKEKRTEDDCSMASLTQRTWVWANSGDSEEQGSLVCCSPWGHKESDMTEWLDNKKTNSDYVKTVAVQRKEQNLEEKLHDSNSTSIMSGLKQI